jgi:predicted ribosome quality control (RQC) complex YloA/Tae2 family protein
MDLSALQELAPLLSALLAGRKVSGVLAGGPGEIVLHFSRAAGTGAEARLLLSSDARCPGVFLLPPDAESPSPSPSPSPGPLAEAMENRVAGAVLEAVFLPFPGDRVVELRFLAPWPRKGEGPRLLLEVMGRRSNLLLLDPAGRILASARTLSPSANRVRPLRLGGLYVPPPPPTGAAVARRAAPPPTGGGDAFAAAWAWKCERTPAKPAAGPEAPLLPPLLRLRDRLAREEARLRGEEARCRGHEEVRTKGEALLIHLAEVRTGSDRIVLAHPGDPAAPLAIDLDPALPPQRNAKRLFDLARRLQRGEAEAGERRRRAGEALRAADAALAALEGGEEAPARALLKLAPGAGPGAGPRQAAPPTGQPRGWPGPGRRYEREGFAILVGKGAADNDRVTFEAAGPRDLWLHARDCPSSHVVVLAGGRPVPEAVVLFAAALCAGRSGAKKDSAVEVMVAERKWVRKVKGGKPGLVAVSRSRTVLARRRKGEEWPG